MKISHTVMASGMVMAALLVLAGCSTPAATSAPAASAPASAPAGATAVRCTAADLAASLGARTGTDQKTVALTFTNTSSQPCDMYGVPGVDLHGPDDATFGPVYSLPRPGADAAPEHVVLAPGASAVAPLTYLTGNDVDPGWVPTEIVTTPPGDTAQLTVEWTGGDPVQRQDAATHPGTYVHAVQPA